MQVRILQDTGQRIFSNKRIPLITRVRHFYIDKSCGICIVLSTQRKNNLQYYIAKQSFPLATIVYFAYFIIGQVNTSINVLIFSFLFYITDRVYRGKAISIHLLLVCLYLKYTGQLHYRLQVFCASGSAHP